MGHPAGSFFGIQNCLKDEVIQKTGEQYGRNVFYHQVLATTTLYFR